MGVAIGIAIGFSPPRCVKPRCVKALGSERLASGGRFRGEGLKGGSELTRLRPRTLLEVFSELDARSRSLGGRCSRRVAHSGLRCSSAPRPRGALSTNQRRLHSAPQPITRPGVKP